MGKNITLSVPVMGTVDAGVKINQAIAQLAESGGGEVFLEAGTYRVLGNTTIKLESNVSLKGVPGATVIDFSGRSDYSYSNSEVNYLISASGKLIKDEMLLKENGKKGSFEVEVKENKGVLEDDLILIKSDEKWYEGVTPQVETDNIPLNIGELCKVNYVKDNVIYLKGSLHDNYTVEKNAKIYRINRAENIKVEGIAFIGKGRRKTNIDIEADYGLGFTYCENVTVRDCKFKYIDSRQLEFRSCYSFIADNCYFEHEKYTIDEEGKEKVISPPVGQAKRGAVQYQVRVADACMYGTIVNCNGVGGRHFFHTAHSNLLINGTTNNSRSDLFGLNRHITVSNCKSTNTWHAAYSTHNDAEYTVFEHCIADSSGVAGFNPRSSHNIIRECLVTNCERGIELSSNVRNVDLINNRVINCSVGVILQDSSLITINLKKEDQVNNITTEKVNSMFDYGTINIKDNIIDYSKFGIKLYSISEAIQSGRINIVNNILSDVREEPAVDKDIEAGIRIIFKNASVNIKGNNIMGAGTYALNLEKAKTCILEDNMVSDSRRTIRVANDIEELRAFNNCSFNCGLEGTWNELDNAKKLFQSNNISDNDSISLSAGINITKDSRGTSIINSDSNIEIKTDNALYLSAGNTYLRKKDSTRYICNLVSTKPKGHMCIGDKGDIYIDNEYVYICYENNTWTRIANDIEW